MSKRNTKVVVDQNDRLTLNGRRNRYFDKFKDGIVLESDDGGPRTVFALTWTDVEDHLRTCRLVIQKEYYGTDAKTTFGKTVAKERIAYFEKFGPLPAGRALLNQASPQPLEIGPLEILAMDEHKIGVVRVGKVLGLWNRLHRDVRTRFDQIRHAWASVAMDACSRSLCALRLTVEAPSVEGATATLAMAVRKKGEENVLLHGREVWPQCGRPGEVHVNRAMAYQSAAFVEAVLGLTGKYPIPEGKLGHVRGRVERMFRTWTFGYFGSLPDVFGNSILLVENYDPAKHSHLTDNELLDLFASLIVERYHNIPQRALDGQTPIECWVGLSHQAEGVAPPPSKEEYRDLFGIKLRRQVTARGISILGIEYRSAHLEGLHMCHHRVEVDVSVDESDISAISFRDPRDECWHDAYPEFDGLNNVALSEWIEMMRYIVSRFGQPDNANRKVVIAALSDLKGRAATL